MLELRITLESVEPEVWRRLLVPGSVRLDKLHRMLQAAMGWEDAHLHRFGVGGKVFGPDVNDDADDELDERSVTVASAVDSVSSFIYEYDFGDSWSHHIVVEDRWTLPIGLHSGVCVEGQGACPPEDCGGPPGYAFLLAVLEDPDHEDHEHMKKWVGEHFDPDHFDLALANARLQAIR